MMHSLRAPEWVKLEGPDSKAFQEVMRAHRLAMLGLHVRASRLMDRALERLKSEPDADRRGARVWMLAGLGARARSALPEAAGLLERAAEGFHREGRPAEVAAALALSVEAFCAAGQLTAGGEAVQRWSPRLAGEGSVLPDLANGFLQLAEGKWVEARQLARLSVQGLAVPETMAWSALLSAEVALDQGVASDAREELEALVARLEERGELTEAYVRAVTLQGCAAVDALWTNATRPNRTEVRRAGQLLKKAAAYAVSQPRYAARVRLYQAQLTAVIRGDEAGPDLFAEALASLEKTGAKLDVARELARLGSSSKVRADRRLLPWVARARDLLTRMGADVRSQALVRNDAGGGAGGGSLFAGSLFAKSMAGTPPSQEDIELHALFEVSRALSSELSLDRLMQKVLDEVVKLLKAERGALLRVQSDGRLVCVAARNLDPSRVREGESEISFSVIEEAGRQGTAVLADNAQLDDRFRGRASVLASDIRSVLCAPLRTTKGVLGYLYVDSTLKARIFRDLQKEVLSVFATQAAVALENAVAFNDLAVLNENLEQKVQARTAELTQVNQTLTQSLEDLKTTRLRLLQAQKDAMESELLVARQIQQTLLPASLQILEHPGLRLCGKLEPASLVGGDFWTALALPNQRTLVLVGDVTGHGLGAGMVTPLVSASCATLLRTLGDLSLETLLATLSDVIFSTHAGVIRMTCFACLFDAQKQTLFAANAGHQLPLLLKAGEGLPSVSGVQGAGVPLGETRGSTFESTAVTFQPGDRVLLFTDGLVEAANPSGKPFGARRLAQAALKHFRLPLDAYVDALFSEMHGFREGRPADDDTTVVTVELGPSSWGGAMS